MKAVLVCICACEYVCMCVCPCMYDGTKVVVGRQKVPDRRNNIFKVPGEREPTSVLATANKLLYETQELKRLYIRQR